MHTEVSPHIATASLSQRGNRPHYSRSGLEEGGHVSSQPDRLRDLNLIVSLFWQNNTLWPEEFRASSETCYPMLTSLQTQLWSYTKENLQTMKAEIYSHPSRPQNWKLSSEQAWSLHLIQTLFTNTMQNILCKIAQQTQVMQQQSPPRTRAVSAFQPAAADRDSGSRRLNWRHAISHKAALL